jgi:hypothetical protein
LWTWLFSRRHPCRVRFGCRYGANRRPPAVARSRLSQRLMRLDLTSRLPQRSPPSARSPTIG